MQVPEEGHTEVEAEVRVNIQQPGAPNLSSSRRSWRGREQPGSLSSQLRRALGFRLELTSAGQWSSLETPPPPTHWSCPPR